MGAGKWLLALAACALLFVMPSDGYAQSVGRICTQTVVNPTTGATGCVDVSSTNPFPVGTTPSGVTTTVTTAAPTAGVFSSILAASSTRKGCLIQNVGTTLGYVYFGATGSATTANSIQVPASGGSIGCNPLGIVLQDNIAATCASSTCAFIINAQ